MQSFFCLPTSCHGATAIFFSHFIHSGVARASRVLVCASRANELSMLWRLISDLCILPCQSGRRLAVACSDFTATGPDKVPILRRRRTDVAETVTQGHEF